MSIHTFNGGPFEQEALIIKTCVPIYTVVVCIRSFEPVINLHCGSHVVGHSIFEHAALNHLSIHHACVSPVIAPSVHCSNVEFTFSTFA